MNGNEALGNAGPAFEQDLQSDEFDRYLLFTYGIDTSLLSWFDAGDSVVVCGPEDRTQEVANTDVAADISSRCVPSHAKLYLMWGTDRIVCWLGSFNFTYSGIFNNVEWAARFSGSLETAPALSAVRDGRVDSKITESWQIQQVLELVATTFTGGDTSGADALLQNTEYPYVLVHSHRSNTLKRALRNELTDASGSVTLTYYSPFVNARGVDLFLETLAPAIQRDEVNLTVRTCRISNISDQDTGLSPAHVARLKEELAGFEYQVRAPGDQGNQLRDGRDLRSGLAHHKTVGLSYVNSDGEEQQVTLLTTANLTKNAWQHNSGNFEIGLLLRDDSHNDQLHELLGLQLSHCYERPRDQELDAAVKSSSKRASFEEVWLEELVSEQLQLSGDRLEVKWTAELPTLESITATIYYRDILTGSRSPETVTLEPSAEGFSASIPPLTTESNQVIDFMELDIQTTFRPPERRLTGAGLERLQRGELSLSEYPGKKVVCDGTSTPLEAFHPTETAAEQICLRAKYPRPRSVKVVHEPGEQPHLAETFLQEVNAGTVSTSDVGGLSYVDVTVDGAITPRHDQLTMRGLEGRAVEYLGYSRPDPDTIRYYLDSVYGGETLEFSIASPLDRYYPRDILTQQLPQPADPTADIVRRFSDSELTAHPSDNAPVIDDETSIEFRSEIQPVPQNASVEVQWGLRGYDRFGSSLRLDETLPPQDPHRQVWFRGGASISTPGTEFTLLTQRNVVTIREQPFCADIHPREDLLPTHLDLRSLSGNEPLAWLVFDREEVLKPTVQDTEKHLSVILSEGEARYQRIICPVLDDGELLCIPLLGQHRNQTLQFVFELELEGGRPEISYYATKRQRFQIEVDASRNVVEISWGSGAHVINHQKSAGVATLDKLADRVAVGKLRGMLQPNDPIKLGYRDGLRLQVREPGLLHLVY